MDSVFDAAFGFFGALLYLPIVAVLIGGCAAAVVGRRPWFHWRIFGVLTLVFLSPLLAKTVVDFRIPNGNLAHLVTASVCAIFVPTQRDASERRWRSYGAWLLTLSLLALCCALCVIALGIVLEVDEGLALILMQFVAIHRMAWDAVHCLRRGSPPPPRPLRNRFRGLRIAVSVLCRVVTILTWLWFAVAVSFLAISRDWDAGGAFALLALPIFVGVVWAMRSIFLEVRAPDPVLNADRPASF